ncbi:MAG: alpha-amylase family glycosyl hydrolase [Bacteroidales bacterium]
MGQHVFHINTPIQLNISKTLVCLEDYINDCDTIQSITAPNGITAWENKNKHQVLLEVTNNSLLKPVDVLHVTFNDGECTDIPLFKSKKIRYAYSVSLEGMPHSVQIAGDFNSWNPDGYNLHSEHGEWHINLEIEPGIYAYQIIVDGNWITDPLNSDVIDNGYGGYNSLLTVPFPSENTYIHATPINYVDTNIVIHVDGEVTGILALWQNNVLADENIFFFNKRLMITIPLAAQKEKRSFIRCYCYSKTNMAQDILIPLEYGKIVNSTNQLTKDDKEAQIIYFILIDRFYNGNTHNDRPVHEPDIHAKLNFHGGDIAGVTQKIVDGYIPQLGINTIWISPIVKNPDSYVELHGQKFTGYHGYWPVESDKIDDRFGTENEFNEFIAESHTHNISILIDHISNHVHKDNPIFTEHPDWVTDLKLPDGSLNIGRWEDQRFTTWFEEFLPTLNFEVPEVLELMTDIAVDWVKKYNIDGFRYDATKHVSVKFWRMLTKKLKEEVMLKENRRLYQIGETFGGREMLQSYINSGIHDGQFSFNVYYELRNTFLYEHAPFKSLVTSIKQDIYSFGAHNLMGYITGNHDMPRFISYAGEDLQMNQNAEQEGWNRHITVKNPVGYKKLLLLTACISTIPGVPVIYYGDEIGMPGGGDPDNRRPMRFEKLSIHEQSTLAETKKLLQLRKNNLALIYGDFCVLYESVQQLVYSRNYFCYSAIVMFNKAASEATISFELPSFSNDKKYMRLNPDIRYTIDSQQVTVTLPAYSYQIMYTDDRHVEHTHKIYNNSESYIN